MPPPSASLHLTFDDGPDPEWTARVLDALDRRRARATFFVLGERVERAPLTVRALLDAGHDVQLHGHRHLRHSEADEGVLARDTERALAALAAVGVRPSLWRAPWGVCTAATARSRAPRPAARGLDDRQQDWRGDSATAMLERIGCELGRAAWC